jgi:flagellar hook-length control protein FliK
MVVSLQSLMPVAAPERAEAADSARRQTRDDARPASTGFGELIPASGAAQRSPSARPEAPQARVSTNRRDEDAPRNDAIEARRTEAGERVDAENRKQPSDTAGRSPAPREGEGEARAVPANTDTTTPAGGTSQPNDSARSTADAEPAIEVTREGEAIGTEAQAPVSAETVAVQADDPSALLLMLAGTPATSDGVAQAAPVNSAGPAPAATSPEAVAAALVVEAAGANSSQINTGAATQSISATAGAAGEAGILATFSGAAHSQGGAVPVAGAHGPASEVASVSSDTTGTTAAALAATPALAVATKAEARGSATGAPAELTLAAEGLPAQDALSDLALHKTAAKPEATAASQTAGEGISPKLKSVPDTGPRPLFAEWMNDFASHQGGAMRALDALAGIERSEKAAGLPGSPVETLRPTPLQMLPIEIGMQAMRGVTRFQIRLDPAELGRVDVKLDIREGAQVEASLVVDRVETLALLKREASTLQMAFEQAGLKQSPDGLQFSLRGEGQKGEGHQGRDQNQPRWQGRQDDDALPVQNQIAEIAMRRMMIPNSSIDRIV